MSNLTIYGIAPSTYTRSARMALIEKGVDFDFETVELGSPQHLALHPFGKIPILQHGDTRLYETFAIGRYVDETFDGPPLQPADTGGRALMTQWISAIIDYVYPALIRNYLLAGYIYPQMAGQEPNRAAIDAALPDLEKTIGVLDGALAGRQTLVGDAPTLADHILLPIVFYMNMAPESAELMGKSANLSAWLETLSARPSAQQTVPPPPPK